MHRHRSSQEKREKGNIRQKKSERNRSVGSFLVIAPSKPKDTVKLVKRILSNWTSLTLSLSIIIDNNFYCA